MSHTIISQCSLCSSNLNLICDFGTTPLANEYLSELKKQQEYPLQLMQCCNKECQHVQINCIVDQKLLFSDYTYLSGSSFGNHQYFQEYADEMIDRFDLIENDLIFEIGSNDSTLLQKFKNKGCKNLLGIDPAENIAKIANDSGILTISEFFDERIANKLSRLPQFKNKAKLIIANNILAHDINLDSIFKGINLLLADDGALIVEFNYLIDILKQGSCDYIYHEHLFYFSIKALTNFLKKYNLEIFFSKRVSGQGANIRIYIKKNQANNVCNITNALENYSDLIEDEKLLNEYIDNFKNKIQENKNQLKEILKIIEQHGKTIAIFGAPAKFITPFSYFELDPKQFKYIIEENLLKVGKYAPKSQIKIVDTKYFKENPVDYVLIAAWNFSESIIEKEKDFPGKWIVTMPEIRII